MIAVDTNVLVYAHREEFPLHEQAHRHLHNLAEGPELWGLPVFCIGEFIRVVTHPGILKPPTPLKEAVAAMDTVLTSPSLVVLSPGERFWPLLREALEEARVSGNLAFDAQIVAVCREHGVRVLLTEDRSFRRFAGFTIRHLT